MSLNIKREYPFGMDLIGRTQTNGEIDYVKNGELHKGATAVSVMVTSESDLDDLAGYTPGTVAFTAGFKAMWQLAADGTWVDMLSSDEED